MSAVWTLGLRGRNLQEVLEILKAYRIERVVDVRAMPIGDGDDFDQPRLAESLREHGIAYDLRRELAPAKHTRDSFAHSGDLELMTKGYQAEVPRAALVMLARSLEEQRCVIMSPERDPWQGTRGVLGRMVERMGLEVKHIV